jgi:chromosome segregation protein
MLKIERIELSGFKSFCDSTEVVFPSGITAVVGPNGCGKSNIGDAINWVLGEQSARMLRGSSMQDVIFSGSEARKATGMAEVTLYLRDLDGSADAARIGITRRLFRDGESEYLLNGSRTRLRDIQDLLREERVGAQTYATIEQGRIDQILNAKPRDRRLIIEEAAGVAGFKHKRRLAELKLEATQANLLRVQDILGEVTRQIHSLKRQAAKARRYRRMRDELRDSDAIRFALRLRALDLELGRLVAVEGSAKAAEAAAAAHLSGLESALVEERGTTESLERSARERAEALHALRMEVERAEATIRSCRERIAESEETVRRLDAEIGSDRGRLDLLAVESTAHAEALRADDDDLARALARLEAGQAAAAEAEGRAARHGEAVEAARRGLFEAMNRLADLRNRARSLEESRSRMERERSRLLAESDAAATEAEAAVRAEASLGEETVTVRSDVEALRDRFRAAERDLAERRNLTHEALEASVAAREQERSAAERLRTLEDVATRFAGVSDGVRAILGAGSGSGVRAQGVVADFVEAQPEFEAAAESYLQGLLPAIIVEDDADACRGAELLRREGAGRTLFLCRTQPSGALAVGITSNGRLPVPDEIAGDSRVMGRLKDRIRLHPGDGFVSERIGDAVVVDSLESALDLHRRYAACDYLTATGDVVYASGLVAAGGTRGADNGLLAHARKIQEAREQHGAADHRAGALEAELEGARRAESEAEAALSVVRAAVEETERRVLELDLRTARTREEQGRLSRRLEMLAVEIASCDDEVRGRDEEAARVAAELSAAESAHGAAEGALRGASEELEALVTAARTAMEEASSLRAEVAALRQRQSASAREGARLRAAVAELEARLAAAGRERETGAARGGEAGEVLRLTESSLAGRVETLRTGEMEAARIGAEIDERRGAMAARDAAIRDAREALEARRLEAKETEVARVRGESERSYLDGLCAQELGMPVAEAAAAAAPALAADPPPDLDEVEAKVADLKSRLESMGPVNLTAIEEFQELEERERFLSTQKKDLEDSVESLRESIRKINRSSRERFSEAFEVIRTYYQEIFRVLFHGGRADLVLEEGEDVLECGIEMIAQPPGKRLGSVSLLSGGEKSMAAIALLFAIFRYRPSPFCLLDEVDAALDDTNVNRFTRMLREYAETTQFILITHNKRSMESADLLYGVTMEEPGISRLVSLRL